MQPEFEPEVLLDTACAGLVVVAEDDSILMANARAAQLFGYTREELLRMRCDDLVPLRFRTGHAEKRASWFAAPVETDMGSIRGVRGLRKDGTECALGIALRALPPVSGQRAVACWVTEESSPDVQAQLRTLYGVSRVVASAPDLERAAPQILEEVALNLGWVAGLLWTSAEPQGELRVASAWTAADPRLAAFVSHCRGLAFRPEQGVIGAAWSRRSPTWIFDVGLEQAFVRRSAAAAAGLRGMVVVPVIFANRLLGALEFFDVRERPLEEGSMPLLSGIGSILGEFLDRIHVSADLKAREEAVRQSEKLEAIGRLAGGVAHDFNNMLTAIIGFSENILGGLPPGSPVAEQVAQIRVAGMRSAELTRQLLAYGRRQMLQPKVVSMRAAVDAVLPMLRRLVGEQVTLDVRHGAQDPCLRVDPGQLDQMLTNLVLNARDAMPRGGRILVESACADLDAQYTARHPEVPPGSYVLLAVTDTGCGMDEATRARLFEPFFTTKELGKGTGLGLATIHGFVKQSGGHIWVYSEPGRGTTFKVYMPRIFEKPVKSEVPAARAAGGRETILLVEDETMIRDLVTATLKAHGYTVHTAATLAEASAQLRRHSGAIALVLSDVILPDGSARQLAQEAARVSPGLRFLFMSGYTGNVIFHDGALDSGVAFIEKPFARRDLLEKIRALLDAR